MSSPHCFFLRLVPPRWHENRKWNDHGQHFTWCHNIDLQIWSTKHNAKVYLARCWRCWSDYHTSNLLLILTSFARNRYDAFAPDVWRWSDYNLTRRWISTTNTRVWLQHKMQKYDYFLWTIYEFQRIGWAQDITFYIFIAHNKACHETHISTLIP